jgi:DNA modification methylase
MAHTMTSSWMLVKSGHTAQYWTGRPKTQKPVALLEYLIKTYTLEGETVLDFTMGSGSTGVACLNTNRNFIGIEKDETYFNIAKKRIEDHTVPPKPLL